MLNLTLEDALDTNEFCEFLADHPDYQEWEDEGITKYGNERHHGYHTWADEEPETAQALLVEFLEQD